jgi:CRP-like cAMP-binding protein
MGPAFDAANDSHNRVRERLKLLLKSHAHEITPVVLEAKEGELLLRQGAEAEQILLLTEGCVAIQVRQAQQAPHTLTILEAETLLGEIGLFGNGQHAADVRVVQGPAKLLAIAGDQLLQAMLFDADLAIELLALLSERCLQGNALMSLLLDGIQAAHGGDAALLEQTCQALQQHNHSLAAAAEKLATLHRSD